MDRLANMNLKKQLDELKVLEGHTRANGMARLLYKLSLAPTWQKRLDKLRSIEWESLVANRIDRAVSLLETNGVTYSQQFRHREFGAHYRKGTVSIECRGYMNIGSNAKVVIEIFRAEDRSRILRITIGDKERVINDVLATLLKSPPEIPF